MHIKMIKIPLHLAYVATLVRLANTLLKDEESARDNHVLACNFAYFYNFLLADSAINLS